MNGRRNYWKWERWMRTVLTGVFVFFAVLFFAQGRFIAGGVLAAVGALLALRG